MRYAIAVLGGLLCLCGALVGEESAMRTWRGCYVSGQLGGGWNRSYLRFDNPNYFNTLGPTVLGSEFRFSPAGFIGGGALGYSWQVRCWVIGVEGGALATHLKQSLASPFFPDVDVYSYALQWLADAKVRVGYAGGCLLPYVAVGWAGSRVKLDLDDTDAGVADRLKKWVNGWTIGVGMDWRVRGRLSLGLSYDYYQLVFKGQGSLCPLCGTGVGFGTPVMSDRIHTQVVLARINLHL